MRRTFTALVVGTALLAGCGGNDNEKTAAPAATATATATATQAPASGGGGGATVKVSAPADGSLKFDQATLSATAGKVTFEFSNPSPVPHAVEIEGNGVEEETKTVTGSDAPPLTVDLKPGEYEYYCPVDGHRQAGMEGKLTVK
jgi:plastocyanin